MKKLIRILIILLILSAAGVGIWYYTQNPALANQLQAGLSQLQVRLGLVDEAAADGLRSVSGFIEAEEIDVAAETKGRIRSLSVDEGNFVEAGQVLVELDKALLEAELAQAEARIATARAQLAKVEAGVRSEEIGQAEAAVAVAEANAEAARTQWQDAVTLRDNPQELDRQIDAARTALELAELRIEYAIPLKDAGEALWELGRKNWEITQEGLDFSFKLPGGGKKSIHYSFDEGQKQRAGVTWNQAGADRWEAWVDLNSAVAERDDAEIVLNDLLRLRNDPQEAQVQVTQAEAAYQTARAEVEVAKAQLEILKAGARTEQISLAQAQVQQAEASLEALQVRHDQHILTAPLDGWVVERATHEGEMAIPGAPLLTLADLSQLTLTVYVVEPDIDLVSPGQTVEVFVDTFPGEAFTGEITFINDEAEFTPKNVQTKEERVTTVFAVKIKLENPEQRLKPGMPADAMLPERGL